MKKTLLALLALVASSLTCLAQTLPSRLLVGREMAESLVSSGALKSDFVVQYAKVDGGLYSITYSQVGNFGSYDSYKNYIVEKSMWLTSLIRSRTDATSKITLKMDSTSLGLSGASFRKAFFVNCDLEKIGGVSDSSVISSGIGMADQTYAIANLSRVVIVNSKGTVTNQSGAFGDVGTFSGKVKITITVTNTVNGATVEESASYNQYGDMVLPPRVSFELQTEYYPWWDWYPDHDYPYYDQYNGDRRIKRLYVNVSGTRGVDTFLESTTNLSDWNDIAHIPWWMYETRSILVDTNISRQFFRARSE